VHKHPGGAEVDLSVMFADVRGSTGIAERMEPEQFSHLMARFYGAAPR
jgi:adenylate cyclase